MRTLNKNKNKKRLSLAAIVMTFAGVKTRGFLDIFAGSGEENV